MSLRDLFVRAPLGAWVAASIATAAVAWAIAVAPGVSALILAGAGAGFWAWREARRFVIAPRSAGAADMPRLSDLAPLLEALPDPALLVDAERRITGSNAAARAHLDFEPKGQFLIAILRQPGVLEAVHSAIAQGATRAVEYETAIGVERHTRCYVAPIHWAEKSAALLVFHDQTAKISTERMRSEFLANASHELRTPLAALTLLIETLGGPARDNADERDRFLKMMQAQADRMRRLIDDLLSLSRVELDEHVPPSDRADLAAVARETLDLLAATAHERGVTLDCRAPQGAVYVIGERFQLAQVVQNLVDNAIKYSKPGGVVKVELGEGEREQIAADAGRRWPESASVALLAPSVAGRTYAFVRVEDAGPGIERRFLARLGQRFFRVERELGQEKGGIGLGLAIVKHILNRHRGGLLVQSQPGRGSAFVAYVERAIERG